MMSAVTWYMLEICSGTGDDDVRVDAVELDVDDTALVPRSVSLVARRDREWARTHLCLDYLLFVGSRTDPLPPDGLTLFQGHLHASSPADSIDVRPVCVWVDERARRRYEPTAGNAHAPLLFEALAGAPIVASPQQLAALACTARKLSPLSSPAGPGTVMPVTQRSILPRRAPVRLLGAALAQSVLALLLLCGSPIPTSFHPTWSDTPPAIIQSSADPGYAVIGPAQSSRVPIQMEPMRYAVLQRVDPEEVE
jgi:hypothetical protein